MKLELGRIGEVSGEMTRRWARRRVGAVQRYGEILERYGRGELNSRAAGEALTRLAADEAARYSEEAIEFGSECLRALFGAGGIAASASTASNGLAGGVAKQSIDIELRAPVGGQATRSFLLENKQDATLDISFDVSDFSSPESETPFAAPVEFIPVRLTLRPHEEKVVEVRLPLNPGLFVPGRRYSARTTVHGYGGLELRLHVFAEPPAA